jgi:hypothetical protein
LVEWGSVVNRACILIRAYNSQGIRPTLRQVHYRLASERVGGYQNTKACYKTLSDRLVKARMGGLIPWGSLADHVRYRWWFKPSGQTVNIDELVERATEGLGEDPWEAMGKRIVVWLEKDALAELIYDAVGGFYIPLAVSRGYSSWTFIYDNLDIFHSDCEAKVLYLGDHDPSGIDIERFTGEAVEYFGVDLTLKRIALTYGQVLSYNLLPNPTKKADPRAEEYVARYGDQCWELDALEPTELQRIVKEAVEAEIDPKIWSEVIERNREAQRKAREELKKKLDPCP